MSKTYDDYVESPEFKKARLLVQEGEHGKGMNVLPTVF